MNALAQARPLHAAWLDFEALHGSVQQQRQAELTLTLTLTLT